MSAEVPPELIKYLNDHPDQSGKFITDLIVPLVNYTLSSAMPVVTNSFGHALGNLGFSEEINGLVSLLAAKSNDSRSEVLRKALTLYGLALDALEKGNRLAVINSKDFIIHDVIGFDTAEPLYEKAQS